MNKDLIIQKLKELVTIQNRMIYDNGGLKYPPSKVLNDITRKDELELELAALEREQEEKPKRIPRGEAKIKICAGCGSFAHGNRGHDIT